MNEQQNVEVVRRGYDAFGRGDLQTLLSLFDDNIEWVSPGPPEVPTSGTRRGKQQVAEFFRHVGEMFEFERFEPKTFIAQGDQVVVLGEDKSRFKATGAVMNGEWAHAFTLRNGKVVRFQEYLDTAPLVAELRAVPTRA